MTFGKRLAIGILVSSLGFSSVALAANKKQVEKDKTFRLTGQIVAIEAQTRYVTVRDSYSDNLYRFYVPKDFTMTCLNTSQRYLSFEQLQEGLVVSLHVQLTSSETAKRR